ncbi:hypothetical protein Rs2_37642 [Raphanus sativus]|nr:hypothetical protein Rs2_37642 [Raphanus sativus]
MTKLKKLLIPETLTDVDRTLQASISRRENLNDDAPHRTNFKTTASSLHAQNHHRWRLARAQTRRRTKEAEMRRRMNGDLTTGGSGDSTLAHATAGHRTRDCRHTH